MSLLVAGQQEKRLLHDDQECQPVQIYEFANSIDPFNL